MIEVLGLSADVTEGEIRRFFEQMSESEIGVLEHDRSTRTAHVTFDDDDGKYRLCFMIFKVN